MEIFWSYLWSTSIAHGLVQLPPAPTTGTSNLSLHSYRPISSGSGCLYLLFSFFKLSTIPSYTTKKYVLFFVDNIVMMKLDVKTLQVGIRDYTTPYHVGSLHMAVAA